MGKIRVKSFDESENSELEAKKKAKREAKKLEKTASKEKKQAAAEVEVEEKVETPDEAEVAEEVITEVTPEEKVELKTETAEEAPTEGKKTKKEKFLKKKTLSARVNENRKLVSKSQTYPLDKAVKLLTQFKTSKFDETVELHVNVKEQGISGVLNLPHGTGKTLQIKIADDSVVAAIEKGVIDFDILVATPDMMPKLAKVARVLGPRGLMPNPKNGTVTAKPDEAVKKLSGGEIRFKTEPKAPVIHLRIGKSSFGEAKIFDNAKTAIDSIGANKIKSATLTSTMSPGIKLQVN